MLKALHTVRLHKRGIISKYYRHDLLPDCQNSLKSWARRKGSGGGGGYIKQGLQVKMLKRTVLIAGARPLCNKFAKYICAVQINIFNIFEPN